MQRTGWDRYYRVVARIPRGRVATYGLVARVAGTPRAARQVGYALAALHGAKGHGIPWHRVLGLRGRDRAGVSLGDEAGARQRRLLAREGVRFDAKGRIDLREFGWAPRTRSQNRAAGLPNRMNSASFRAVHRAPLREEP